MKIQIEDVKLEQGYQKMKLVFTTKSHGNMIVDNVAKYDIYEKYISMQIALDDDKVMINNIYFNDLYSFAVPEEIPYKGSTLKYDTTIDIKDGNIIKTLKCENAVFERIVKDRFLVVSAMVEFGDNYDTIKVLSHYIELDKILSTSKQNIRKETLKEIVSQAEAEEMGYAIKDKLREGTLAMTTGVYDPGDDVEPVK